MQSLIKEPAELLRQQLSFGGVTTITSLTSIAVQSLGLVPGSQSPVVTHVLFAGALTIEISGGTHGERYTILIDVIDADAQPRTEEIALAVLDQGWTMPDGSAPMLSIKSIIARFGIDEVVRMTDERGDGRIGKDLLVAALIDAQGMVAAHVGARYALPFDQVPSIIEMYIADIARGRLYPGGTPEGILANARYALKQLERIQTGAMPLAGAAPAEAGASEWPVLHHSGGRTYPDGLKSY